MPVIAEDGMRVTRGAAETVVCTVSDLQTGDPAGWDLFARFAVMPGGETNPEPDPDLWPTTVDSTDATVTANGSVSPPTPATVEVRFTPAQTDALRCGERAAVFALWERNSNRQLVRACWCDVLPRVGAGPWAASPPPPPPPPAGPVPVSAVANKESGVIVGITVTFDRAVTSGSATGWSCSVPGVGFDGGSSSGSAVLLGISSGAITPGDPVTVSYDGLGDAAGVPDGTPAAAFGNFGVSNPP